ncbi:MAG: preprotein translocase subunit SecE [Desulfobacteraceae bacterium]|nr:preprotein translocase subunit SecE [Desulfobacteraceae bacterium]
MQKKKPTEKKKKNKSAEGSVSGSATGKQADTAGVPAGSSSDIEAKRKKQKSSYSGTGRAGAEQTFVVKLVNRYFGNWIQFLREVKVELARVTWPSRKETVGTTAVVLVFVFIIAIFLGAVDFVLSSLVRLIL